MRTVQVIRPEGPGGRLPPLWELLDGLPSVAQAGPHEPIRRFGGKAGNRKSATRRRLEAMEPGAVERICGMTAAQLSSTWWHIRREFPGRKYSARTADGVSIVTRIK
jgi:hypothetical protein